MNKKRRKKVKINLDILEVVKNNLDGILFEEEEAFDNMQNLQYSIKGEVSEEAIENLSDAISLLSECIDSLNNI